MGQVTKTYGRIKALRARRTRRSLIATEDKETRRQQVMDGRKLQLSALCCVSALKAELSNLLEVVCSQKGRRPVEGGIISLLF